MDRDVGGILEPPGKSVAFNELLEKLRSVHEKVCARNVQLETENCKQLPNGSQAPFEITAASCDGGKDDPWSSSNLILPQAPILQPESDTCKLLDHDSQVPLFETIMDDPWLPSNFLAPKEGALPRRPPRRAGAPMIFDVHATEVFGKQSEDLGQCIDNLAKQQTDLREQITRQHEYLVQQMAKAISQITFEITRPVYNGHANGRSATNEMKVQRQDSKDSKQMTNQLSELTVNRPESPVALQSSMEIDCQETTLTVMGHETTMFGLPIEKKKVQLGGFQEQEDQQTKTKLAPKRFAVESDDSEKEEMKRKRWTVVDAVKGDSIQLMREHLRRKLNSTMFSLISTFLILSYAVLIAAETHLMSQDPESDSLTIKVMHYVYISMWCTELCLRFFADGRATWRGPDGLWNKLDAFFILSGFTEIILENTGSESSAGEVVRGVRICRVVRTVRLVRTFRHFHEFQKMAYALLSSMKTLLCSLALLIFVMFFFSVWFTQSASDFELREQIPDLDLRYGNLAATTYTLFLSVSNGISWDLCFVPLQNLSWWSATGFILYIIIVLFGVLNVVTSVFVESVIRSVQHYKDLIVQDVEEERKIALSHVAEVFRQIDSDGSGQVSMHEMEHFLGDQNLRRYMEALDIDAADTRMLFKLLDYDGSGIICVGEFCEGCLRLKGAAKSIDVHALTFQIKNFLHKWGEFTHFVEESFAHIEQKFPGCFD